MCQYLRQGRGAGGLIGRLYLKQFGQTGRSADRQTGRPGYGCQIQPVQLGRRGAVWQTFGHNMTLKCRDTIFGQITLSGPALQIGYILDWILLRDFRLVKRS